MTKRKKKPYYPNNWEALSECPAEWFDSIPFDEFMDWKMGGWEIPSSISCIIRERNIKTGKVKEHVYRRTANAKKKAKQIMNESVSEFVVCTSESVDHLFPTIGEKHQELYDDPIN